MEGRLELGSVSSWSSPSARPLPAEWDLSSDRAGGGTEQLCCAGWEAHTGWAAWLMALSQQYCTIKTVLDISWSTWDCTLLVAERHLWHASIQLYICHIPAGKVCLDLMGKKTPNQPREVLHRTWPLSIPWCCLHSESDENTKPCNLAVSEKQDEVQKEN